MKPAKPNRISVNIVCPIENLMGLKQPKQELHLPPNTKFDLIVDYPLEEKATFSFITGANGMGLQGVMVEIGKAYTAIYDKADKYGVYGHGTEDLMLAGIKVDLNSKKITLEIGS